jgi:protease-4
MGPPPYGPPPRRGGILRAILATLLLVILLDLILINLAIFASIGAASTQSHARQITLVDGNAEQIVAAIPVDGLITDDTAHQFDEFLSAAEADKTVKAIVLEVDTPGGSASASDTMHHRLSVFRANMKAANRNIPVIVSMGGMATSGGYYVSCGGDYIFAEPITMTANIGVLMPDFNIYELMNKYGIKDTTIVGSGGTYKDLGSMFQPVNDKATEYLQGLCDAMLDQFKKVVIEGRKSHLPADTSDIFNGRVYMGPRAMELGLVDKIGYREDAYEYAQTAANISGAKVVRYQPASTLEKLLDPDAIAHIAGPQAKGTQTINLNGVNVDLHQLADLLSPRPMYLWMGK